MRDSFLHEKTLFLAKKDRSTKGSIDPEIKPLLDTINSYPNYYTTSSCSGRIVLLTPSNKKKSKWLYVTHQPVTTLPITKKCWLLQEPPIVHIRCKDLKNANILLKIAQRAGLKKSGIISLEHITVEIKSSEKIETLVTPALTKGYIQQLLSAANQRLLQGRKRFDRFQKELEKLERSY